MATIVFFALSVLILVTSVESNTCYVDNEERLLRGKSFISVNLDTSTCREYCKREGYFLFGLEYGKECFCGNKLHSNDIAAPEECMEYSCSGNSTESCGGKWRILVDYTELDVTFLNVTTKCFIDDYNDRVLTGRFHRSLNTNSPFACQQLCKDENFSYFGVEWGRECFCGDDSNYARLGEVDGSQCNYYCSGFPALNCGGKFRIAIGETGIRKPEPKLLQTSCYVDQSARAFSKTFRHISADMTLELCQNYCLRQHFPYYSVEYGRECYCGTLQEFEFLVKADESKCNYFCVGNKQQICGGKWFMSVGETGSQVTCYNNDMNGVLSGEIFNSHEMTVTLCQNYCANLKYRFFGVEASSICLCGNDDDYYRLGIAPNACNTSCSGDESLKCGGNKVVAIGNTGIKYLPLLELNESPVLKSRTNWYQYMNMDENCYEDEVQLSKRAFTNLQGYSSELTPFKCFDYCKVNGYLFFGIENGNECYCGNSKSIYAKKGTPYQCTLPCSGNSSLTCGGKNRISIGETRIEVPLKCYASNTSGYFGVLSGNYFVHDKMTPLKCKYFCAEKSFLFFGLSNGNTCHCGDNQEHDPKGFGSLENQCNIKCTGNPDLYCGGDHAVAIGEARPSSCFSDEVLPERTQLDGRILSGQFKRSNDLTPDSCSQFCESEGFQYFGTEFGEWCYCGNNDDYNRLKRLNEEYEVFENGGCQVACSGDASRICGGEYSMSIGYTSLHYSA